MKSRGILLTALSLILLTGPIQGCVQGEGNSANTGNSIFIKGFEIKNLNPAQQKVKEFAKTKGLDVTFTSRFGDSELIMKDNLTKKNYFAILEGETVTLYHIASSYAVDKNLPTSKGYNGQVVTTG
ncbi:MAG: hypothetical protein ACRCXZ_09725, partial [Patescibacteria group bacterium]